MVDTTTSRFELKRSLSIDSIQASSASPISRLHFSQLLRLPSFSNLHTSKNDLLVDNAASIKLTKKLNELIGAAASPSDRRKSSQLREGIKRTVSTGDDGYMREKRHEGNESKEQEPYTTNERRIAPRRRSTYCDEYSKRERERQTARASAATLVREQKLKKEFSDTSKPFNITSPGKKSRKIVDRRIGTAGTLPTRTAVVSPTGGTTQLMRPTTDTIDPIIPTNKIRLHTTAPMSPQKSPQRSQRLPPSRVSQRRATLD